MELTLLSQIGRFLVSAGKRALYPGVPFFSVPLLVLWLIVIQFHGSLMLSPGNGVSALPFSSELNSNGTLLTHEGTLVVIPPNAKTFALPLSPSKLRSVRVATTLERLRWNETRLALGSTSLNITRDWVGVDYPLVLMLEGVRQKNIAMSNSGEPALIPPLELATQDALWIALGALLAAIFSIGLAVGYLKDSGGISDQDAGNNVGHLNCEKHFI